MEVPFQLRFMRLVAIIQKHFWKSLQTVVILTSKTWTFLNTEKALKQSKLVNNLSAHVVTINSAAIIFMSTSLHECSCAPSFQTFHTLISSPSWVSLAERRHSKKILIKKVIWKWHIKKQKNYCETDQRNADVHAWMATLCILKRYFISIIIIMVIIASVVVSRKKNSRS